jgi:hypothetical protein
VPGAFAGSTVSRVGAAAFAVTATITAAMMSMPALNRIGSV